MILAVEKMMEDGPSVVLFVGAVVVASVVAAAALPPVIGRLSLKRALVALALVGPGLGIIGSLIGTGAMTLSGHDIWYALTVSACTGAASIVIGWRLARPMARDLDEVVGTIEAVADGERRIRTGIERGGEIGRLATAVEELSRSLARAETERSAADGERRSVVSSLSHDLRTPLASLLVSVDALEDGVGEAGSHLRSMRGNVLALESLVGDLFLLARADSGSLELSREPLDLAELIDEAVEAVEPVASVRSVRVTAPAAGPLPVSGDHQAIGRVLRNLLDNAIRHSPDRGVVGVGSAVVGGEILVEVRDEGPGFPAEFVTRAFDRFSQADGARSRPGGAGLGLAIAQTLMASHDGAVEILPGPGGRVRIRLPLDGAGGADAPGSPALPGAERRSRR